MAEWKKIPNWPYSVSDDGRVRNDRTGYYPKPIMSNCGYYRVRLWNNGLSVNASLHRLVAEAFVPNKDGKPEVNHKDGNKANNCAGNLEWMTPAENKRHCREVLGKINRNPDPTAAHEACKKPVRCIETGEIFESITYAARCIGASQGSLSNHLLMKSASCKGRHFEYA